ncbi:MAG: extracellular solute-binding protein [Candidatus Saccharibacteria bacterium]|nr:extracellular solute-binding protein [Rhodoferax sp.]
MIDRRAALVQIGAATTALAAPALVRAQPKSITWATHPAILAATGDGEMLRRFEAKTGIKVETVTFPTDVLGQRIQSEFISRSSAFDVVNIADSFWTSSLARFVEPLDELNRRNPMPNGGLKDFFPGMLNQFRVPQTSNGPLMGIPSRLSVSLMYYRKDLLEAAKLPVPRTLEEYVAAAKAMTKPGMHGVVMQGVQGQQGTLDWYDWAAPLGCDLLQAPDWKKAAFNSTPGIRALEARRRLVADGTASPGSLSFSFDDAVNSLAQSRAAMSIMFSGYWQRLEDPKTSQVAGKIGWAPIFRNDAVDFAYPGRGWALSINGSSAKKDMAWEFIRFLTDTPQQKWMGINKGNAISRMSVLKDPEFVKAVPVALALALALPRAKMMPNTPQLSRVYDALGRHVSGSLGGKIGSADALGQAEAECNLLLA